MFLSVHKSIIHKTTIAAIVSSWAVNKLLFWKTNQFFSSNLVSSFQCAGWTKCPTRTTPGLILHWCHSTRLDPVNWLCQIRSVKLEWNVLKFVRLRQALTVPSAKKFEILIMCPIRENVVVCTKCVIVTWVNLFDRRVTLGEHLLSEFIFFLCSVAFTKSGNVLFEFKIDYVVCWNEVPEDACS